MVLENKERGLLWFRCTRCKHEFKRLVVFGRAKHRCPVCHAEAQRAPLLDLMDDLNSRPGI